MTEKLYQLGEQEILNRLKRFMPKGQINDDTAELGPFNKKLLINTDVLVENIHFSERTTSANDVGWRATTANLSDLAASGVEEILGITIGLVAPPETPWRWIEDFYMGMEEALKEFGGKLLGGDCSNGTQKLIAITAIGTLGPLRLHRSRAKPGDYLVTSGPHGLSRLGLALLMSSPDANYKELTEELKSIAIKKHQRPVPPLKALNTLKECKPRELPWRAAGTDSSDGLIEAINCLCKESGCQALLDLSKLPRINNWPCGSKWDNWCLQGGEDFELVLSLPPAWAEAWLEACPTSYVIGLMKAGKPKIIWNKGIEPQLKQHSSFQHFKEKED